MIKGKLEHTELNMQRVLNLAQNKAYCYGINEYKFVCYVSFESDETQLWALVSFVNHQIRNCGENIEKSEHRSWSAITGMVVEFHDNNLKLQQSLTMFQNFNAMRIYLTSYFKKTNDEDIGLLLSGLMLSSNFSDWRENPRTWDPVAWDDWMCGVNKTLHDKKIKQDPLIMLYDEQIAFLCMKNYLHLFYKQISFEGVGDILKIINAIQIESKTQAWHDWVLCVQAAVDQEINIIA